MGKKARARVLPENKAQAIGRSIRTSPRKLNLVAQAIIALAVLIFLVWGVRRLLRRRRL